MLKLYCADMRDADERRAKRKGRSPQRGSAFGVSLLVIRALMDYVRKKSFSAFGIYRIILGGVVLLWFVIQQIF